MDSWKKAFEDAKLDELREKDESRTGFILRFTLSHPDIHTTVVGTRDPERPRANIQTAQLGALAPDVYSETKCRLDAAGLEMKNLLRSNSIIKDFFEKLNPKR